MNGSLTSTYNQRSSTTLNHMPDDSLLAEVKAFLTETVFGDIAAWLGSDYAAYLLFAVILTLVYAFVGGTLMEKYENVTDRELLKQFNRRDNLAKIVYLAGLGFVVTLAYQNPVVFAGGLGDLLSTQTAVNVLIIIIGLLTFFILPSIATTFPDGPANDPVWFPGLAWFDYACAGMALVLLYLGIVGFFPGSKPFQLTQGILGSDSGSAALMATAERAGLEAIENGDRHEAVEQTGYAVAAAGSVGDLDQMEAMLEQLERARSL